MEETDWRLKAECIDADPEVFFPMPGNNGLDAKRICARCDVVDECLQYALENDIEDGVWGGKSGIQRLVMLGRRRERSVAA